MNKKAQLWFKVKVKDAGNDTHQQESREARFSANSWTVNIAALDLLYPVDEHRFGKVQETLLVINSFLDNIYIFYIFLFLYDI